MTTTDAVAPTDGVPGDPEGPVLIARGVTMRFGGLVAVNNVDLDVHRGEIVGLIGPNGAGKTTFFNCLTGQYQPTQGQVIFNGQVLPPKPVAVVKAGVARTFQNIRLFGNMTAMENVMVGRYCRTKAKAFSAIGRGPRYRREERETRDMAIDLLTDVGLLRSANHLARSMPYGDQRRLEIARALATEPSVLLLDEPTAGMNPQETRAVEELIVKVRGRGLAIVVIEHDMRFIFSLCDRVACLVRGEVLIEGPPSVVQSDPRVIEAYIGTGRESAADAPDDGAVVADPSATPAAPDVPLVDPHAGEQA
jgi:branched-chain amino acid transport system ATP-binding protein